LLLPLVQVQHLRCLLLLLLLLLGWVLLKSRCPLQEQPQAGGQ
jgi:hypothetical protein